MGIRSSALLLPALLVPVLAPAQGYPEKPVRIIAPFAPGGNVDITARIIGQALGDSLGQTFVVENRGGAGGMIGAELAARAAPDGYTLLLGSNGSTTISPLIYAKVGYDPVRDFAPISLLSISPMGIIVHPSIPARTVKEFVALARARAGKLTMASAGTGTSNHLAGELFQTMTGTRLIHVPYKGSGPALVDLVGGQVDLTFDQLSSSMPHLRQGKLRAIAVTTAARSPALPETPTIAESGVQGYEASTYAGLLAPAGVPREVVARLNGAVAVALKSERVRERFASLGADPTGGSADDFGRYLRDEYVKWARVVKTAGVKAE